MSAGPLCPTWNALERLEDIYMPGYHQLHQPMHVDSPPWQPMDRYMHEHERPMFRPGTFQDHPMQPYPDVLHHKMSACLDSEASVDSPQQRYASPSYSGHSASHPSSTGSDRDWSPGPSPFIRHASYAQELCEERYFQAYEPYRSIEYINGYPGGHCVALHDVQQYADAQPEPVLSEEEATTYGSYAQEGYQPMQLATPTSVATPMSQYCEAEVDCKPVQESAPVYRRRRANTSTSPTLPVLSSRIAKRPQAGRRRSSNSNGRANNNTDDNAAAKPFPCPFATYGCSSTFGSKNEWKRHVTTQHLRLGFWRCDQCPGGERKHNDFNRKDLFIQHVRRMHPVSVGATKTASKSRSPRRGSHGSTKSDITKEELLIERRCYRQTRAAPEQSGCMFCDKKFGAWEERMEHVGRHMDTASKSDGTVTNPADWKVDDVTEDWLVREKIVRQQQGRLVLV